MYIYIKIKNKLKIKLNLFFIFKFRVKLKTIKMNESTYNLTLYDSREIEKCVKNANGNINMFRTKATEILHIEPHVRFIHGTNYDTSSFDNYDDDKLVYYKILDMKLKLIKALSFKRFDKWCIVFNRLKTYYFSLADTLSDLNTNWYFNCSRMGDIDDFSFDDWNYHTASEGTYKLATEHLMYDMEAEEQFGKAIINFNGHHFERGLNHWKRYRLAKSKIRLADMTRELQWLKDNESDDDIDIDKLLCKGCGHGCIGCNR